MENIVKQAKEAGVLCIADEVAVGFGRTGHLFASQSIETNPDLMCFSKALTAGFMPLAVTTCTDEIYQAFYDEDKMKTFYHGHSFTANPMGCAAALASLELLLEKAAQDKIRFLESSHKQFIQEIKNHPVVQDIRSCGTIMAFEVKTNSTGYLSNIRDLLYHFYMDRGVLLRPLGNIIYIYPPLSFTEEELEKVYQSIRESLDWIAQKMKTTPIEEELA
jgi:adenosylmethionine-8-amino-7-oxononanoate aminotransferase